MELLDYLKLFFIFILFFGILYGGYYFSTKFNSHITGSAGRALKVLKGLYLGQNKSIQIVKIYDRYVVLSVTKDRIEKLMELSPEEIFDEEETPEFQHIFEKFKKKGKSKEKVENKDEE